MNLIALIIGLVLERSLTRWLHLRELAWLDDWFGRGARWIRSAPGMAGIWIALVVMLLPVVPVAWVAWAFRDALFGFAYLAFAAVVLFFSLGPYDLMAQLKDWLEAHERGELETADEIADTIRRSDQRPGPEPTVWALESAIFVQANHRIFGVIFWFMLLGPAGAWAYRVSDLFRRHMRATGTGGRATELVEMLFGLVAWIPARLLALSYAVSGSFDDAFADWRAYYQRASAGFFSVSESILSAAGIGAIRRRCPEGDPQSSVRAAYQLLRRTVLIWITVIAALTLVGWAT
jgi:membrane protein required for beta-lactamase induction